MHRTCPTFTPSKEKIVRSAQSAETEEERLAALGRLAEGSPEAAAFLSGLHPTTWALSANPHIPFHSCEDSKADGTVRGDCRILLRRMLPFAFFAGYMQFLMENLFERRVLGSLWPRERRTVTPYAEEIYARELERAELFEVSQCDDMSAYVWSRNGLDLAKWRVDLQTRRCSCTTFTQTRIPCRHYAAFLKHLDRLEDVYGGFSPVYLVANFVETFEECVIHLPVLGDIQRDESIQWPQRAFTHRGSSKRQREERMQSKDTSQNV
jgi:hypothetical protein